MPTQVIQKQQMVAGEVRYDPSEDGVVFPSGLTSARIELSMTPAEARDPSTNVLLLVQWRASVADPWGDFAGVGLVGNPSNDTQNLPHILVTGADVTFLTGKLTRAKIVANSAGNYGARVITS